jgi:hypothetical protein
LALSVSDAGEFLREFKITDTVHGGNLNFVTKSSKDIGKSFSGAFEMSDFIVKNNAQLTRLISLSSTNCLTNGENLSVGFNFCMGNFTVTDSQITVESGRAISPGVALSYSGSYDRVNDNFDINGISLPMSAFLNNANTNGALVADYSIIGSLGVPIISVKPLRYVTHDSLNDTFGNMLPVTIVSDNTKIVPAGKSADPFSQGAFDRIKSEIPEKKDFPDKQVTDDKFGVKITRGVKNAD